MFAVPTERKETLATRLLANNQQISVIAKKEEITLYTLTVHARLCVTACLCLVVAEGFPGGCGAIEILLRTGNHIASKSPRGFQHRDVTNVCMSHVQLLQTSDLPKASDGLVVDFEPM